MDLILEKPLSPCLSLPSHLTEMLAFQEPQLSFRKHESTELCRAKKNAEKKSSTLPHLVPAFLREREASLNDSKLKTVRRETICMQHWNPYAVVFSDLWLPVCKDTLNGSQIAPASQIGPGVVSWCVDAASWGEGGRRKQIFKSSLN